MSRASDLGERVCAALPGAESILIAALCTGALLVLLYSMGFDVLDNPLDARSALLRYVVFLLGAWVLTALVKRVRDSLDELDSNTTTTEGRDPLEGGPSDDDESDKGETDRLMEKQKTVEFAGSRESRTHQ